LKERQPMNREQAKRMVPIVTAIAEGKTVQFRWDDGQWRDIDPHSSNTHYNCEPERWRLKPAPQEWWICVRCKRAFESRNALLAECGCIGIHVREVLE
jgi:hypothetical protein